MTSIDQQRAKENFPVASRLLLGSHRQAILALYQFARQADDIADDPNSTPSARLAALKKVQHSLDDNTLAGESWSAPAIASIQKGDFHISHLLHLLDAFCQDNVKTRYTSLDELIAYSMRSAAPIGRAVLEIHQEWDADYEVADRICCALQLINHLQDVQEDLLDNDRVYIPNVSADDIASMKANKMTRSLQAKIDALLGYCDHAISSAPQLLSSVQSWRLRCELATIIASAKTLNTRLRKHDILSTHVKLSRFDTLRMLVKGIWHGTITRKKNHQHTGLRFFRKAKSSFFWPLMRMNAQKRKDMISLYAFCRHTDNITDGLNKASADQQLRLIQKDIQRLYSNTEAPKLPIVKALLPIISRYSLPKSHFDDLLSGYFMDIGDEMVLPSAEKLDRYCYSVASTVGLLSIHIFGYTHPQTEIFAIHLGKALQYTNILRDVTEDARMGRVYLAKEWFEQPHSSSLIDTLASETDDAHLQIARGKLIHTAEAHYRQAMAALTAEDTASMKPALLMMQVYRNYFDTLCSEYTRFSDEKPKLGKRNTLKLILFPPTYRHLIS